MWECGAGGVGGMECGVSGRGGMRFGMESLAYCIYIIYIVNSSACIFL